jgi:anti-anti-sigma factor
MGRMVRREQGVVVEMHDRPCLTTDDYEQVKQLLIRAGRAHPRLVVDCSAVLMLTGSFLSALLSAYKALGARPGDIVLCELAPIPRQVFEVTRVDTVLPIYTTREEALRAPWPEPTLHVATGER